jgi:hypothetical protein
LFVVVVVVIVVCGGGGGKKLVSVTFLPHTCFVPAD